jgi:membrane-bound lytic murein transglycosylase D
MLGKNKGKKGRSSFLCAMIKRKLLVMGISLLCACFASAQTMLSSQAALYREAAQQKVCALFEQQNPSFFTSSLSWKISAPHSDIKKLFPDYSADFSPEEINAFSSTFSASTLVHQKALVDFYGPLLERKLMQHQVPGVLKYLPTVLTGNNASYADAQHRAGMWAMSYPVAIKHKLRVDSLIDERCGGDLTTEAAARYLSELNLLFKENLSLVLLAYWKSPAYVRSFYPNETTPSAEIKEDDIQFIRYFMYVSTLFHQLAAPHALEAYFDVYGGYRLHFFERSITYSMLHQVYGVSVSELRSVNPVYKGEKIDSSYRRLSFLLPLAVHEKFTLNPDELYTYKEKAPVVEIVDEYVYHRVKSGETLGGIAKKYRVSVSQLKAWNNLKRTTIRKGQTLKIRQHKRVIKEPQVQVPPVEKPTAAVPSDTLQTASPPAPKPVQKPTVPTAKVHTVRSGESLWIIAKKYKTTPEKIMKLNGIGEKIRPGQKLKIPQ